ncbi:protein of unknown function [Pseudomonas sp. JV551A1]|uniref:Uncharacterized protein n=1 Tax=Pseudomonas inefficax TaxID=2078786 RepID=A0AAQ1SUF3_9PSED|nr:protein of unknown function [Pseudomonas sp. JV551A1]SPO61691.1 protein of unknown function [Pseudomonas inefficax]
MTIVHYLDQTNVLWVDSGHSRLVAIDPKRALEHDWYRKRDAHSVGAGLPAKQAPRWMAPAAPVFAGKPAPTIIAVGQDDSYGSLPESRSRLPSAPTGRQLHRPPILLPGQLGDPRPRW